MKAIEKIKAGNIDLSEDEIIELLRINNFSSEYYDLLAASNALSRRKFGNRGYVFTQIGINAEPCPINCNFCSMAATHYSLNDKWKKSVEDICQEVQFLQKSYLMTFHDDNSQLSDRGIYLCGAVCEGTIKKGSKNGG